MLPPVLEIYVLWHPEDRAGEEVAQQILDHFHGTAFSGLIGGAIEVYVRSEGWAGPGAAPRPLPCVEPLPHGIPAAAFTAVVPVLGNGLADAVDAGPGPWRDYIVSLVEAHAGSPGAIGIFPLQTARDGLTGELDRLLGPLHLIGSPGDRGEDVARNLAQALAQMADGDPERRLTVFLSHTKRAGEQEEELLAAIVERVRTVIGRSRLGEFFDANAIQSGTDWAATLVERAATSALLAVRTDLYSSRAWCQREMVTAKQARMPVVILDVLTRGEARGSFVMDHVPRIPAHREASGIDDDSIFRALNQLVDECLKRALWNRQAELAARSGDWAVSWWAAHAPEPVTFARWLREAQEAGTLPDDGVVRVLHPDPPLGADEIAVLDDILAVAGQAYTLDVLTPRGLAARGG